MVSQIKTQESQELLLTFGKHKGSPLCDVPTDYLLWGRDNLSQMHWRKVFDGELVKRGKASIFPKEIEVRVEVLAEEEEEIKFPLIKGGEITLRAYQETAVRWLIDHSKYSHKVSHQGGILADDMGLGKTLEALVAAKILKDKYGVKILVVSPVSLIEGWKRSASWVNLDMEIVSNHHSKIPAPLDEPYIVIFDEAHGFQDPKSMRTKKFLALATDKNCMACWLLTGTPIKNGRPINLFPLLLGLDHFLTKNPWQYKVRYCNAKQTKWGWDFNGASHLDELSDKLHGALLRRTKAECLPDLPAKTRIFHPVTLESSKDKEFKKAIKEAIAEYESRVVEGKASADALAIVTINLCRKIGSQFKAQAAIEMAQELLEQGKQIVLFTEFLESAHAIHDELGGELLTGESSPKDRQEMVDRFQSGQSKVFVGTIKAGGVGLTLTSASDVILVDRAWTPGDCYQAEDRCHRIGQKEAVFSHWIQLGRVDQEIDNLLESKDGQVTIVLKEKGKSKTIVVKSPAEMSKALISVL